MSDIPLWLQNATHHLKLKEDALNLREEELNAKATMLKRKEEGLNAREEELVAKAATLKQKEEALEVTGLNQGEGVLKQREGDLKHKPRVHKKRKRQRGHTVDERRYPTQHNMNAPEEPSHNKDDEFTVTRGDSIASLCCFK